jgi:hypothetical protein
MKSHNVGSNILPEKTELEIMPARQADGVPANGITEEVCLDDLLDYQPVPPRRVTRIAVRYQRRGRGLPLPYFLDEVSQE